MKSPEAVAKEPNHALMHEARQLVRFYDANGWDWTCALAFTLCRDMAMFGPNMRCHPAEGYRYYPFPKVRTHGKPRNMEPSHADCRARNMAVADR